jgi:hypothetical protein
MSRDADSVKLVNDSSHFNRGFLCPRFRITLCTFVAHKSQQTIDGLSRFFRRKNCQQMQSRIHRQFDTRKDPKVLPVPHWTLNHRELK